MSSIEQPEQTTLPMQKDQEQQSEIEPGVLQNIVKRHIYNHKRDNPDVIKKKFHLSNLFNQNLTLPLKVDLRTTGFFPKTLDQQDIGSCTSNATSNALRFCLLKQKGKVKDYQPSRLFIYYFSRLVAGTPNEDSGCSITDVMSAVKQYGVCDEQKWPYNTQKFKIRPPETCCIPAKTHTASFQYYSVNQNINFLKTALASGFPVLCGVMVYESFESETSIKTGCISMPDTKHETLLGGHCILLIGYNDVSKVFIFQNSWGTSVGQSGFFTIPYNYILDPNLGSDFWVVKFFA